MSYAKQTTETKQLKLVKNKKYSRYLVHLTLQIFKS